MNLNEYVNFATKSFTLPDVCIRIRNMLDDYRTDADDIAQLISLDPSLTAKMLRLANSSLFRFPSQVESISKAVSVIGGEALYNLVMAETANSAFKHFDTNLVKLDRHWQGSIYCGMVARHLAKQHRIRGSERFFVMGILQNLSELIVAKCNPKAYEGYILDKSESLPWERQQRHFGFTFALCSGTIMEHWKLPMPLFFPVKYLHDNNKACSDTDIAILSIAMRVTIKQHNKDKYASLELVNKDVSALLNLDGESIGNAVEFANKETAKVAALIL